MFYNHNTLEKICYKICLFVLLLATILLVLIFYIVPKDLTQFIIKNKLGDKKQQERGEEVFPETGNNKYLEREIFTRERIWRAPDIPSSVK